MLGCLSHLESVSSVNAGQNYLPDWYRGAQLGFGSSPDASSDCGSALYFSVLWIAAVRYMHAKSTAFVFHKSGQSMETW
jgi:hypothetical protein